MVLNGDEFVKISTIKIKKTMKMVAGLTAKLTCRYEARRNIG
jgi:hypothetical protein